MQLNFDIVHTYDDSDDGIVIPVILNSGGNTIRTQGCVDCGAGHCLFSNEVGKQLGLDIESGFPMRFGPASGGSLEAFGHEVNIQTLGLSFDAVIFFAKYPGLRRNLLGRIGWLRYLQVGLIDYRNLLCLSKYE